MEKITIHLDGMMCGMCEAHVCDAIRRGCQVKKVTASHARGQAVVWAEEPLDEAALRAALAPTGYRVLSVERTAEAPKRRFGFFR